MSRLFSTPAQKITFTLFSTQSIVSAGTIAMSTVMAIVGKELSGNAAWAGLPSAVMLISAAISAFGWGILWDRIGRRNGLSLSILFGAIGLAIAITAYEVGSFGLLLVGLMGIGFARSGNQLSRFIASDVNQPSHRGRAISYVVFGGTIGAIVGPLLVDPASKLAVKIGLLELSGPFLIAILLFGVGILAVQVGLRPAPSLISKQVAKQFPEEKAASGTKRKIGELLQLPVVRVAMIAMIVSQMVMTMLMGITALHMKDLSYELSDISKVFSAHTMGMFAFAIISGRLADKFGRIPVIVTGSSIIILAGFLAANYTDVAMIALALFLLGLGWNFCFVAGSALLADQLSLAERSRTQGFNDLFVSFASAVGSLGSGFVYAASGYFTLGYIGVGLIVLPLIAALLLAASQRRAPQIASP